MYLYISKIYFLKICHFLFIFIQFELNPKVNLLATFTKETRTQITKIKEK